MRFSSFGVVVCAVVTVFHTARSHFDLSLSGDRAEFVPFRNASGFDQQCRNETLFIIFGEKLSENIQKKNAFRRSICRDSLRSVRVRPFRRIVLLERSDGPIVVRVRPDRDSFLDAMLLG